jgi:hypothetical protein
MAKRRRSKTRLPPTARQRGIETYFQRRRMMTYDTHLAWVPSALVAFERGVFRITASHAFQDEDMTGYLAQCLTRRGIYTRPDRVCPTVEMKGIYIISDV